MIKIIRYIYQFLYFSSINKYNFISFFPLLSIITGTIIIFFTIGIMDGMEEAIFKKMESFNFSYSGKLSETSFADSRFDIYKGKVKKYLIFKDNYSKIITVTSIDNFDRFKNQHIADYMLEVSHQPGIVIGKGLADELKLKIGDKISIASPVDINLVTGIVPMDTAVNISGIFNYKIMDYDYNYAFISNDESLNVLSSKDDKIFLKSYNGNVPSKKLINQYKLSSFKDSNQEFLKAINTEKLLYSSFGYIVIFIASASSISLMSLFIVRKRKQLGILRVLGFRSSLISKVLVLNSLLMSLAGVLLGSSIYLLIISINNEFYFIQNIFFNNLPFDFLINFNFLYFIQALLISSILMICGSIYPILKISKINLSNTLKQKI